MGEQEFEISEHGEGFAVDEAALLCGAAGQQREPEGIESDWRLVDFERHAVEFAERECEQQRIATD